MLTKGYSKQIPGWPFSKCVGKHLQDTCVCACVDNKNTKTPRYHVIKSYLTVLKGRVDLQVPCAIVFINVIIAIVVIIINCSRTR